jgi:hypothetical protein
MLLTMDKAYAPEDDPVSRGEIGRDEARLSEITVLRIRVRGREALRRAAV